MPTNTKDATKEFVTPLADCRAKLNKALLAYFDKLAAAHLVIPLREGMPDVDQPELLWSIYAVPDVDELVMLAIYRGTRFIEIGPSGATDPSFIKRILADNTFVDMDVAQVYARRIWRYHASKLFIH